MAFKLSYKGKKLSIDLKGEEIKALELQKLLETMQKLEETSTESLRNSVVKQLKSEMLQITDDDLSLSEWFDIPQDLIQGKETGSFISMESDLNAATQYEKTSFALKVLLDDNGKTVVLDRESISKALQKLQINEKITKTKAVLVRIKGSLSKDTQREVEDYLRKHLSVERLKVIFENKGYGQRASLEIILFGEFSIEQIF